MTKKVLPRSCRGVCVKRLTDAFGAWHKRRHNAFTLIELVVVSGLILVLTGLVLSTVGYARKKGARARAETEIAAMSAACESYKADNGTYPRNAMTTDTLDARGTINMPNYQAASQYLYGQIAGDPDFDGVPNSNAKSYMQFRP